MVKTESWARRSAVLLITCLLLLLAVISAGCLVDEETEPGDTDRIPRDRRNATLDVSGDVNDPSVFTLADLVALGTDDFEATFVNSVGTTETANYTGVRMQKVLDEVGPKASAEVVSIIASDGYGVDLFLSDVSDDTYLAMKKDGEWQDLANDGAIRVVDTNLMSVYWVRHVVDLTLGPSFAMPISGLANITEPITAAYVHSNGEDVEWQEGERTRTGRGIPMEEIIEMVDADTQWGLLLDVMRSEGGYSPQELQDFLGDHAYYLAESLGRFSIIRDGKIWTAPVAAINVTPGVKVYGDVGHQKCMTLREIMGLPIRDVDYMGSTYRGAALEMVLLEAGSVPGVDAVEIIASDGYSAVFPYWNVTNATLAYEKDGEPLGPDDGYLRVVDSSRPSNFHVSQVQLIRVFKSDPIQVEGSQDVGFNASSVLTIGFVDGNANDSVSYNDGRRDRTYPATPWRTVLDKLRFDANVTWFLNISTADGTVFNWSSDELVNATQAGLAVDTRGRYVAVRESNGEVAIDVVAISFSLR